MKMYLFPRLMIVAWLACGCTSTSPEELHPLPINPNIKTVVSQNPQVGYIGGNCALPVYGADSTTIFVILGKNDGTLIGSIFKIIDSGYYPARGSAKSKILDGDFSYIDVSSNGQWLVGISSSSGFVPGNMRLLNLSTLEQRFVSDSLSVDVFAAVFLSDNSRLIYYGRGRQGSVKPQGFYRYDINNGRDSLLGTISAQPFGFDVRPDRKKLIYGYTNGYRTLDLETGSTDSSSNLYGEWFRYSPDGKKILYCDNATHFRGPTREVGLIDVSTKQVSMLDVNANGDPYNSNFTPFLKWSRDGKRILFSQTGLSHDGGYPGLLGLYILKAF